MGDKGSERVSGGPILSATRLKTKTAQLGLWDFFIDNTRLSLGQREAATQYIHFIPTTMAEWDRNGKKLRCEAGH